MKRMNKALIIISLVSGIVSCRVYDKLLYVAEESLDKEEVSIKFSAKPETDIVKSVQDSGRSGRRARSLADDRGSEQEERVKSEDSTRDRKESKQAVSGPKRELEREANEINSAAEKQLLEVKDMFTVLNQTKTRLDEIKTEIDKANSDLQEARETPNKSHDQLLLLPKLDQAINKVRISRHVAVSRHYTDIKGALRLAESSFKNAKSQAELILGPLYSSVAYAYRYQAIQTMSSAERLLKAAQKYQVGLEAKMKQVEKDFDELKQAYEDWKRKKTL
ncbi:hypothetical protein DB313_05995 (plasmid) [Borrelia turcica IST7]|uniref:Uncharacterized protein n=1 Tax=Borrelia turcica IST7 TaxID=1104446 RepID=A0A386PQM0_9SPIR|nr:hypothetical protein [Borrelia turcica]AYE37053.1 hypothetical protein DB313_05995 [Borrelia turcica IST7]